MQRAAEREDKVKKEEVKPEESSAITRKWYNFPTLFLNDLLIYEVY